MEKKQNQKIRKPIFLFQLTANTLFGLQYFVLSAYSAAATSALSIIKNLIFMHEDKKTDNAINSRIFWLVVFELFYVVSGVFTYNGLLSLIPIFIAIIYTWAAWQKNFNITCIVGIIVGLLWVVYNFSVGAYVSIITGFVESISGAIGLKKNLKSLKNRAGTE